MPVQNESAILELALERLKSIAGPIPVIVVDGGSTDGTPAIARNYFRTEELGYANRGAQMNHGAAHLDSDTLLFLHADTELPPDFATMIRRALQDPCVHAGCFRLRFDHPHPMLRFYGWWTRFPGRYFHFGDQAIFVRRHVFEQMGGYRNIPFLEDVDFLRRLRRQGRFSILRGEVTTSSRRFLSRGILRQQLKNILIVALFELGVPAERLQSLYRNVR